MTSSFDETKPIGGEGDGPFRLLAIFGETTVSKEAPPIGELSIGRAPENDFVIEEPSISRRHARIRFGSDPTIEDLGSANGVWIADHRLPIGERRMLRVGEPVRVGAVVLVLQRAMVDSTRRAGIAPGFIAKTEAMRAVVDLTMRIAPNDLPVLVLGETGVGKEVVAMTLHRASKRANGPFISVNCGALPATLIESELFGHAKGAFSGAHQDKRGLIEAAHGGTFFLDEVGELPLEHQVRLLRAIEERRIRAVGSVHARDVDVRLIAATNRDLARDVEAGRFRRDLYFRINSVIVEVPPLRERREEILELVEHFAFTAARRLGRAPPAFTPDAINALATSSYPWPGNLRELRNVVERAMALTPTGAIGVSAFPDFLSAPPPVVKGQLHDTMPVVRFASAPVGKISDAEERARIVEALAACGGNQSRAAKLLGMSRRTLASRLDAYGLPRPIKDQKT